MKILFITLSNIGDVILSLPVLDSLIALDPNAEVTVLCGERPAEIFKDNPRIKQTIVYKKHRGMKNRIKLLLHLNRERYDLVVDLKNSALPLFLKAHKKTYPWSNAPKKEAHMRNRHLYKAKKFIGNATANGASGKRSSLYISENDNRAFSDLLSGKDLSRNKLVLVAPGARSHIKRWPRDKFAKLTDRLIDELHLNIALIGDEGDSEVVQSVIEQMSNQVINLCGETTLKSLALLIQRAHLVISCDSACMHLGSYLDKPTLAIFGPTNENKYGPWSKRKDIAKSDIICRPCEVAQCRKNNLECMADISVDEVYEKAKKLL